MVKKAILINLDKKDYDDLHKLMDLAIQSEDGITVYRVTNAIKKQDFYRQVISKGIEVIYQKYIEEKKKRGIE